MCCEREIRDREEKDELAIFEIQPGWQKSGKGDKALAYPPW
jgi:hypothetical protein